MKKFVRKQQYNKKRQFKMNKFVLQNRKVENPLQLINHMIYNNNLKI